MAIYDISVRLTADTVTWTDPEPALTLEWGQRIGDSGAEANVSQVAYGSHFGTHVDAPLHFIEGGGTVDGLDLDVLIGPCVVAELPDIDHPSVTDADLDELSIPAGTTRLLLKTSSSRQRLMERPSFFERFIAIAPSGARWLLDHGVKLIGIDYLSVGSACDGTGGETHRILLGAKVIALEGLVLTDIGPGPYRLICLPLKVSGAEGAPARAVLIDIAEPT